MPSITLNSTDIMQNAYDETICGSLCQHPSCWDSHRRIVRGIPNIIEKDTKDDEDKSSDEENGLPTQKIVNLLSDYGEDPRDKYPSQKQQQQQHLRHSSSELRKPSRKSSVQTAKSRQLASKDSYSKILAPQSSPVSYNHMICTSGQMRNVMDSQTRSIGQVEVQEVFDMNDLSKKWPDNFESKKYYVWIPNSNKKKKRKNLEPLGNITLEKLAKGPSTVAVMDKTEEMIPREVEWHREQMTAKRERKDRRSPIGAHTSYTSPQCGGKYVRQQVFYELMDIPRDVLTNIVNGMDNRGPYDDNRFAQTLSQLWPRYERDATGLSLASSDVLKQKKMKILDKTAVEEIPEYYTKPGIIEEMKTLPKIDPSNTPEEPIRKQLNSKEPLPKIGSTTQSSMSRVLLGLPTLPSGLQYTKTFTYKRDQHFDFTLEPNADVMGDNMNQSTARLDDNRAMYGEFPIHAVSPTYSTNVPQPPHVTPAALSSATVGGHVGTDSTEKSASRTDSLPTQPRFPSPGVPGSGILRSGARSTRNVRFNLEAPPQPPTTPDDQAPTTDRSQRHPQSVNQMNLVGGASMVVNYTDSVADDTSLIVIGQSPASVTGRKSADKSVPPSPEEWPQINEEEFAKKTPTPPPSSGKSKQSITHTIPTAPPGTVSPELAVPPYMTSSESPAPPPPSPEHLKASLLSHEDDPIKSFARGFTGDLLSTLPAEDKDEESSQYTISAKPPSTLEDISRINTPNNLNPISTPNRPTPSRDSSKMEAVTEEKESARSTANGEEGNKGQDKEEPTGLTKDKLEQHQQQQQQQQQNETQPKGLDQFDAKKEDFDRELKSEYEKLCED